MERKYFKDFKLQVAYFHHQHGISLDDIAGIFVHKSSEDSAVISARGARSIRNPDWFPKHPSEEIYSGLYQNITIDQTVGDGLLVKDMRNNHAEVFAEVMRWGNGYSTDRLIVLAHGDAEFPENLNPELKPVVHRIGGVDLVVEFLLSNFANAEPINLARKWIRLDGRNLSHDEQKALAWASDDEVDLSIYRFDGWSFDFSLVDNFSQLEEFFDIVVDPDVPTFEKQKRAIYNIDQSAVEQMQTWVKMPYEIREMLSEEQLAVWRKEKIPRIILKNLDFLGIKLFGLSLDSYSEDGAASNFSAFAASWDDDLRDWIHDDD